MASTYDRRRKLLSTAVSVVCRNLPGCDALAHEIDSFIGYNIHRRWTIELVCGHGHEQLLRRLVALEPVDTDPLLRSHVFSKTVVYAVRRDNLALLESLTAYSPTGFVSFGMEEAAASGKVHLLEWLETNCENIKSSPRIFDMAAFHGHVPALEWLKAYFIRLSDGRSTDEGLAELCGAIEHAAAAGRFEVVQWLCKSVNRFVEIKHFRDIALRGAFKSGRLEIIKYMRDLGYRLGG